MPLESPLAYVASCGGGASRRRRDARIAAVLAEFGYRTELAITDPAAALGPETLERVSAATLVVCDLVRPDEDIPVEVAIAATRRVAVLALIPADAPLGGITAQLLRECGADILRYDRAEPHQVLHARLAERESGIAAAFGVPTAPADRLTRR
ncbi:MAG TPA: hypothetical protein VGR12_01245 [Solirubrobacteraceae bacterium]|nr:hypothetical protein [Solirubrobacteraceae bacterium]